MSDLISTIYAYFSAIDYKGENVLSSYALPHTPLRFVPEIPSNIQSKIVWNFGDGTTSNTLTALKYWEYPGQYNVNLVVYDCHDNALISTFTQEIIVKDFTKFTFDIDLPSDTTIELKNGQISGPWTIRSYYPLYQSCSDLYYDVIGSNSKNYFDIIENKFSHLDDYYSLFHKISNISLSSYQYEEIDKVSTTEVRLYAKIQDGTINYCLSSDEGAFFVGLSAENEVYFKDDSLSDQINISFFFDKNTNNIDTKYRANPQTYLNNLKVTLSAKVIENDELDRLSITSNGLDGEGFPITSFNISPIKFYDTRIPFVIKMKDTGNFSVKNFNPIEIEDLTITLNQELTETFYYVNPEGGYYLTPEGDLIYSHEVTTITPMSSVVWTLSGINSSLSAQNHGGCIRGYMQFPEISSILDNMVIIVSGNFVNDQGSTFNLSGSTTPFDLYPKNYYKYYKTNEDFDPSSVLRDLRFQESLIDKEVLFEFLGTVLGDNESTTSIGRTTYEKIANYVNNISDVDTSETESLMSMAQMLNSSLDDMVNMPENIKRLINTLSISKNKLFGTSNKFNQNFDIRGRSGKDEFGINLGDQITNSTYIISAGIPIVALEKFSNEYTLLNTLQPVSAVGGHYYQLSGYDSNWGWPLVLPSSFSPSDFDKYYTFFEYTDQPDGRTLGGVIDFGNTNTTVLSTTTYGDLFNDWGVADNLISYTLYDALSLFEV